LKDQSDNLVEGRIAIQQETLPEAVFDRIGVQTPRAARGILVLIAQQRNLGSARLHAARAAGASAQRARPVPLSWSGARVEIGRILPGSIPYGFVESSERLRPTPLHFLVRVKPRLKVGRAMD
jgi:hypothetical protein